MRKARQLVTAASVSVMVLTGCGGSSSDSSKTSSSKPAIKGPAVTAPHFKAARPAGFRDTTSAAQPNAATGKPPEVQLQGSRTGGLRESILVQTLTDNATAPLKSVANQTISLARGRGDTVTSGPDATTVDGDDAYSYRADFMTNGKPSERESVLIRHGHTDFLAVFVAAPKDFAKDQKRFTGFLDSLGFTS